MITRDAVVLDSFVLDEAKAFLRVDSVDDDSVLYSLLLAAIGFVEDRLDRLVLRRTIKQTLNASSEWQRLAAPDVASITSVEGLPAEGAVFTLPPANYAIDIDAMGDGWVRVLNPGSAGRIIVTASAGMAIDWASVPESIRLAVLRIAAHFYAYRDAPDDDGPPPAVSALLTPWKRMRLS